MREQRPTFSGELEPVKLNPQTLSVKLQASLNAMLSDELGGLAVDVDSRPTLGHAPEWRLNVPIKEPRLYAAISELVNQADMFCKTFVELGAMEPREFTVSVWCTSNNGLIKGSFD
jgi:myo-inositol catabolism protein IolC